MENNEIIVEPESVVVESDLFIENYEEITGAVGEGEVLQNYNSALTSPDHVVQPLVDSNGNYYPWEYYQVIHDACSVAIQENVTNELTLTNDALEDVSLYSLGILSMLVLGGAVWLVKSFLSPKS